VVGELHTPQEGIAMSEAAPEAPATESDAPEAEAGAPATEAPETEKPEGDDPTGGWDPEKAREKIRKANAEAKALRERAKTAETSVGDKDRRISELESTLLREKVGRKLGLEDDDDSREFLDRLKGSTEEEILADAEKLLGLMQSRGQKNNPPPGRRPSEDIKGGRDSEVVYENDDPAKLAAAVRARRGQ
jgi:hypothetical protein